MCLCGLRTVVHIFSAMFNTFYKFYRFDIYCFLPPVTNRCIQLAPFFFHFPFYFRSVCALLPLYSNIHSLFLTQSHSRTLTKNNFYYTYRIVSSRTLELKLDLCVCVCLSTSAHPSANIKLSQWIIKALHHTGPAMHYTNIRHI